MGQTQSLPTPQERFSKTQLTNFLQIRLIGMLSKPELAIVRDRASDVADKENISTAELAYLLKIRDSIKSSNLSGHTRCLEILLRLFSTAARLPFLELEKAMVSVKDLLSAAALFTTKSHRFLPGLDLIEVLFLGLVNDFDAEKSEGLLAKSESSEDKTTFAVDVVLPATGEETAAATSQRIRWDTFSWKEIGQAAELREIATDDLVLFLTLLIIIRLSPPGDHWLVRQQLVQFLFSEHWDSVERAVRNLVGIPDSSISYTKFKDILNSTFKGIFPASLRGLLVYGLLSPGASSSKSENRPVLPSSRLMDAGMLASLSTTFANLLINFSPQNIVELYNGSRSGFSVRQLELKIFKWQAPTIFIVSGKRLKHKTTTTNRRYQQFDSEYPRYFRSRELQLREWQTENDTVTYAVYVNEPWKASSKRNFGDETTAIISVLPTYDVFTSRHNPTLGGHLIYFSNQGMGVGFGNDQPVNKNSVRKYLPGSVSLTVEGNLEFAIFRHVSGTSASDYFNHSTRVSGDFEDRFMITDLEVWGLGTTKELEAQKKQWEWEEEQAKSRQSVNMDRLAEDRLFLEMAGLVGNHGSGGSV